MKILCRYVKILRYNHEFMNGSNVYGKDEKTSNRIRDLSVLARLSLLNILNKLKILCQTIGE